MSSQTDDFALGSHALLGRAIGEVNGLQRRVGTVERDLFLLQERLDSKPTRTEFAFYIFGLMLLGMIFAGSVAVMNLWWLGKLQF
ncbi:MAG: hypothetical protein KJZ80_17050 [Hyphomicrobiaceae bacterium]|nr:hypothetical protein [Hyphomicrobiaceae bacterium]